MSRHVPYIAQSSPPTVASDEYFFNLRSAFYSPWLDSSVQQPSLGALPYAQPPFSIRQRSPVPTSMNPFNPPEDLDRASPDARRYAPTSIITPAFGWERHPPPFPTYIPSVFPPAGPRIDTFDTRPAAPSTNDHPIAPSPFMSIPTSPSDPLSYSSTQNLTTPGTSLPTAAVAPGPSIVVTFQEITTPPEQPVLSSCDFGTALTLSNALKRNFSPVCGDSTRRAFPRRDFAAKLAFWLKFRFGNDFHPRRKQVTVITTKKSVIGQPSKARLAHLVAREMERYLKECELRKTPFPYGLDDIVLRRIDLISKGTIRPRLYVRSRRPRSIRSISAATC